MRETLCVVLTLCQLASHQSRAKAFVGCNLERKVANAIPHFCMTPIKQRRGISLVPALVKQMTPYMTAFKYGMLASVEVSNGFPSRGGNVAPISACNFLHAEGCVMR